MVPKEMYNLSRQELEDVLRQAIAKTEQEHERNRQTLAADIYQTLPEPAISSEQEDDNLVDLVFQALDKLDPSVKKHLEQALIARHYGINYLPTNSLGNVVPLKNNSSQLEQIAQEFPYKIYQWSLKKSFPKDFNVNYGSVHDILKPTKKSIDILADANILEQDNVQIYVAAVNKIDTALGNTFFDDANSYRFYNAISKSLISGALSVVGGTMYSLITGDYNNAVILGGIGVILSTSIGFFCPLLSPINQNAETKYKLVLFNHVQKNASTLEFDLNTALEYSQRLQEQLAQENVYVNDKYHGKESVILHHLAIARQNLAYIHQTIEEIKKEKTKKTK